MGRVEVLSARRTVRLWEPATVQISCHPSASKGAVTTPGQESRAQIHLGPWNDTIHCSTSVHDSYKGLQRKHVCLERGSSTIWASVLKNREGNSSFMWQKMGSLRRHLGQRYVLALLPHLLQLPSAPRPRGFSKWNSAGNGVLGHGLSERKEEKQDTGSNKPEKESRQTATY